MWIDVRAWCVGFFATHIFVPFHYEDKYTGVVCGLFTTCSLAPFYYKDRCARVVCGLFRFLLLSFYPSLAVYLILLYEVLMIAD